jgi:hypothetical protein
MDTAALFGLEFEKPGTLRFDTILNTDHGIVINRMIPQVTGTSLENCRYY